MVLFTYVHLAQKLDILYTVLSVYLYAVASDPTVTGSVFMKYLQNVWDSVVEIRKCIYQGVF